MKIRIGRKDLLHAVQVVGSALPAGRSGIPVLQNVKLQAEGKRVEVIATDLEVGARVFVDGADVKEGGTIVVPAETVTSILREGTDEEVTVTSDKTLTTLEMSDGYYKVVGADPTDFPEFPEFNAKTAQTLAMKDFREMIGRTAFAVAAEVTRYALTGVLCEIRNDEVRMVASDGKRLALVKKKTPTSVKNEIKVIVPPKALHLLEKVLGEEDTQAQLNVTENQIKIKTKTAVIFSRLVEGTFPDYEQVIPKGCDKKITVAREALESAMRRAALLTSPDARATKLVFRDDKLVLYSRAQDRGESKVEIPIKYGQEEFEVIFNPLLFVDALRVMKEETIQIDLKDRSSACVLRDGKEYLYLVMPLAVQV